MLKHILVFILSIGIMISFSSCSSSKVDDDSTESAAVEGEEDSDIEAAEDEDEDEEYLAEEDADDDDEALDDEEGDDEELAEGEDDLDESGDDLVEEDEGEEVAEEGEEFETVDEEEPAEQEVADTEPVEEPGEPMVEDAVEPEPEAEIADSGLDAGEPMDGEPEVPMKTWVSVKKVNEAPYNKNGVLVNAIYIAREGDTAESISQKVFGREDVEAIYRVNKTLRRGIKVGDKIYYNSPTRPDDSSQLLTFYEDQNLAPETYVSQPGDNIRVVAKNLLGSDRSWMEVYATNPDLDSKGEVEEGTRLRYWASTDVAQAPAMESPSEPMAKEPSPAPIPEPPPVETAEALPPPPTPGPPSDADLPPPPPPPAQAGMDIPPPPPAPGMDSDIPPPPPAPPSAVGTTGGPGGMAPPPPPAMKRKRPKGKKKVAAADDQDQTMMMGAGAILMLAAAALFIVMKKKRAKKDLDFHTATHTQID